MILQRLGHVSQPLREWFVTSEVSPVLFLFLIAVLMFSPFLFGGQMFAGNEPVGGYYQYSLFYQHAVASGQSFLWNPHSFGGFPTYLNQFGSFLSPLVYLFFKVFPFFFAYYFTVTLAVWGGMVFSYFFGRSFFLSRPASLLLALTYCIVQSPDVFQYGLSYAHSFLVLPALLFSILKAKKTERLFSFVGYTLLGALAVAVGFLAGFFVTFLYALVFAGLFALFLDFFGSRIGFRSGWQAALSLGGMFGLGVIAGSPVLIALHDLEPFTSRTAGYASENTSFSKVVPADFVRLFFPYNLQFPVPGSSSAAFLYFGFLPLFLMLTAVIFFYQDLLVMFFALLYLLFIALAMNLPGAHWFNLHVPPFDHIGGVGRWLLVGSFAPAFLAGYGFDRLIGIRDTAGFLRFWKICKIVAVGALGLLAVLQIPLGIIASSASARTWIFTAVLEASSRPITSLKYPLTYYTDVIGQQLQNIHHTFSFSNPQFVLFLALICAGLLVTHLLVHSTTLFAAKTAFIFIVGVTCLGVYTGYFWVYSAPADLFFVEPPPVATTILDREKDPSTYRFVTFEGEQLGRKMGFMTSPPSPQNVISAIRALLLFESGTAYGLESIEGFEQIRSLRQNQLISTALSPHLDLALEVEAIRAGAPIDHYINTAILKKVSPEEKTTDIAQRLSLLSMMNVKYIISLYPLKDSRLKEISSAQVNGLPVPVEYALYENRSVLPRLYFAAHPTLWEGSERDLFIAMLETKDFSKNTYLECAECTALGASTGTVAVMHTENGLLEATTTSTTGGWLVYSESNLPGWVASIDGVRVPIHTANYLFQAIEIPKGEHQVAFRYVGSFALFLEKVRSILSL